MKKRSPPQEITPAPPRTIKQAVAFAIKAWQQTVDSMNEIGADPYDVHVAAKHSFLNNMPTLDCEQGVGEYIACVAWAMQREVFSNQEARNLLYAAQLAMAGFQTRREKVKTIDQSEM